MAPADKIPPAHDSYDAFLQHALRRYWDRKGSSKVTFVALLLGIVLIRTLLISWKGRSDAVSTGATVSVAGDERGQYRDRLQRELERFDENNE